MKHLILVLATIFSINTFATVVEVVPLENGVLFEDDNWGAIDYYAKRLEDNTYIWLGNDRKAKLYKPGKYEIGGQSVNNICYSSSKVINVKEEKYKAIELNISCE